MGGLTKKFKEFNNKEAILFQDRIYKYIDIYAQVNSYIDVIKSNGIKGGEIVFLQGDYSFHTISCMFALVENKNVVVPITQDIPAKEIKDKIESSKPSFIFKFSDEKFEIESLSDKNEHPLIEELIEKNRSGLILFSSGSTGKPKAMIHDFDNLISTYFDKKPKNLRFLVFLLFDHIGGVNTLLNCLSMGATIIIPEKRDPNYICELIERQKIHVFPSSPTFLNLMLLALKEKEYDLTSLKLITYGTEPMPVSLLERVKNELGGVRLLQTFGTSETGIAKTTSKSSSSTLMKIQDGETEYRVVEGELWLKSKTQIMGYLNHSMESFSEDGWFKTGDLAEETEDGYIRIIGRLKEVINVGGEKVLPGEIESCVLQIPEVKDCLAFSMPNAITGQNVAINVSSNSSDLSTLKKKIRIHCKENLDSFKVPRKINFTDEISYNNRFKKKRNF